MNGTSTEHWENYWILVDSLQKSLTKSKAIQVNSEVVRNEAKKLVQHYFRNLRPELMAMGIPEDSLTVLDKPSQELIRLSTGRNKRTSYRKELRSIRSTRAPLEIEREQSISFSYARSEGATVSKIESLILDTLQKLVPSARMSYEQALADLYGNARISYRGTATELRECLRETLDHLAPNEEVIKSEGFKLEKNTERPTMKQKARFILKARGVNKNSLSSPQDAIKIIEESAASLARSVYTRSSISTHTVTAREEVMAMKMYVDSVLAELLQIHRASK